MLGASLAAAVEERNRRSGQAEAVGDSLQAAVETLRESKRLLEEERCQNVILKEELRNQLLREADSLPVKEGVKRDFGRSSIT